MTPISWHRQHMLLAIAGLSVTCLIAGIIWSSDRGLELTDEAYYLLSAIHPDQIKLYISAQHWVLAPLWSLTGSLQGFRLLGAAILLGSAALLALGATRCLALLTGGAPSVATYLGVAAAGGVGALLYAVTIAPSPSYNLLASAGAYGAAGCALLAMDRRRAAGTVAFCVVSGGWLAICLINKPSAGICVGLTVLALVIGLFSDRRKWLAVGAGILGTVVTLTLFLLSQPSLLAVQDSIRGGLDLFRMVQTEPVAERLVRYAVGMLVFTVKALLAFAPAVILAAALPRYPRRGLALSMLFLALCSIIIGKHYQGGMTQYVDVAETAYVLLILAVGLGFRGWIGHPKVRLLVAGLIILPFSISIGTGNSLFTQVIVALAPWTILATLLCLIGNHAPAIRLAQTGVTLLLLTVIPVQVLTSYTADPYHLNAPLTDQSEPVAVGRLGTVRVDPVTLQLLADMDAVRTTCAIQPDAYFLGLYNVPGLALVLDAIPPVTPWVGNAAQTATVLSNWQPKPKDQVVLALTPEAQAIRSDLMEGLRRGPDPGTYCGSATFPKEATRVEFWLSRASSP